ncbi:MAG TPA: NAD(P)/FAD-dependent oxidoreductase [Candidatus Tumulicola sp.]|jgi:monoamine oxidase
MSAGEYDCRCDVAIVGAGAAGLAAAEALSQAGKTCIILEARDRVGGRAYSQAGPSGGIAELGAEFVHGKSTELRALLARYGVKVIDVTGARIGRRNGKPTDDDAAFGRAQELIEGVDLERPDESVETFLRRSDVDARTAETVRRLVGGFDAADPVVAGVHAIAREWRGEESLQVVSSRPAEGYEPFFTRFARSLDPHRARILLQTVVERIDWSDRGPGSIVSARRYGRPLVVRAETTIVTVPAGVLEQRAPTDGALTFSPSLPVWFEEARQAIAVGHVVRVVLRYARPCWESTPESESGASFFSSDATSFPAMWTVAPSRDPLLTMWAGGPATDRFAGLTREEIIARAVADALRTFGDAAGEPLVAHYHDWAGDPYARGAYSYLKVGAANARERLAQPIAPSLCFAGEAAATIEAAGTVGGALSSGVRAARIALTV